MVYWNQKNELNSMSSNFWIEHAEEFLSFVHPSERDVLHPLIIDRINSLAPMEYLDFGAGDGRMSAKINKAIPIDIYDISQIMIENARINLGDRLKNIYHDIKSIPPNHYDVIVCSMVLICISDKSEFKNVLSSIKSSLKPGGKAIFSVTHPCFRTSFFSDFYTEFSLGREFNYFYDGLPFNVTIHDKEKENKVTFEDYHWSLSFMINSLLKSGLIVTEMIETNDDYSLKNHNKNTSPFLILITERK